MLDDRRPPANANQAWADLEYRRRVYQAAYGLEIPRPITPMEVFDAVHLIESSSDFLTREQRDRIADLRAFRS